MLGQGKRHIHMNYMYCLCPFKQKVKEDNKGNPPKIVQKEEEENGGTVQYKDGVWASVKDIKAIGDKKKGWMPIWIKGMERNNYAILPCNLIIKRGYY